MLVYQKTMFEVIVIPWAVCPPERVENPRALASRLSYVQADKHGITILCHLHQCRLCTHEVFRAKVG